MKEKVIDAAIKEFTKSGLKFKMNDIAKSMGISKRTIYTVFDSKEAVLEGITDKYFADFLVMQKKVTEDKDMDVITKIETILCALPEKYQNIGLSNLCELSHKYPTIYKRLMGYVTKGWDLVEQYLEQGMKEQKIRNISIPIVMTMIEGTVTQFMQNKVLVEHSITYEEAKKEMVKVIINGIRYE
ncbi:transcriptional regulator, TetR family [Lachnospiraceae bacterium KM106-2]|nr:transcriptional regulator, TetR family [Lachnospiraceae bacterium KM106-2]